MWNWGGNYCAGIDRDMQDVEISLFPSLSTRTGCSCFYFNYMTTNLIFTEVLPDLTRTDRSASPIIGNSHLMLNTTILGRAISEDTRSGKITSESNGQFAPWKEL